MRAIISLTRPQPAAACPAVSSPRARGLRLGRFLGRDSASSAGEGVEIAATTWPSGAKPDDAGKLQQNFGFDRVHGPGLGRVGQPGESGLARMPSPRSKAQSKADTL